MANIALDVRPLPLGLKIAGSIVVVGHLLIVTAWVLGAPSGPWQTPMGPSMAIGPQFVKPLNDVTIDKYLRPLRLTHNYHFETNHLSQPGVYFEIHLKDKTGNRFKTVKYPDAKANFWVQHRQSLLAHGLAQDEPVAPPQSEVVAAPQQKVEMQIWEPGPQEMRLRKVPQHLVPRDRPVMKASEWSLVLAKAYGRYACRIHQAESAEVVRHTREAWQPGYLFGPIPPNEKLVCNFGEIRRD